MALKETPEIKPSSGGRLMPAGTTSLDTTGVANYARKVNWRRVQQDAEGRREGWVKFRPNTTIPLGSQYNPANEKLTLLAELVRPNSEQCVIGATKTKIYRHRYTEGDWVEIGSGYSENGKRWEVEPINGWLVFNNGVDLPFTYRVEDAEVKPIYEMRERGIASVGYISQIAGMLVCANIVEIATDEIATVMNSADPYGIVDPGITVNHRPCWIIRSEIAAPRNWAPRFTVTLSSATDEIELPFPSQVFVKDETRVAVLNGGPNGGVLGGDSSNPNGILVVDVDGETIKLAVSTDSDISYPRTVSIMRWEDQSTIVGYDDLQDDSAHIIGLKRKGKSSYLFAFRDGSIFRGRYTGNIKAPLEFRERYRGKNVPLNGACIVDIDDEYFLYPSREGGRFYAFDGENNPYIHRVCDDARKLFFNGLKPTDDVWAINNPITKEAWFCRPGMVFAYDYEFKSVSEIDATITAAAYVSRPGWDEDWFILAEEAEGRTGNVFTYGNVAVSGEPILTFLRDGENPGARLLFGYWSLGDSFSEKMLTEYVVLFSSDQANVGIRLRLYGGYSASEPLGLLLTEDIEDATKDGMIPMFYQGIYFQDELSINTDADIDVRYVGKIIERGLVKSKSVTRNESP